MPNSSSSIVLHRDACGRPTVVARLKKVQGETEDGRDGDEETVMDVQKIIFLDGIGSDAARGDDADAHANAARAVRELAIGRLILDQLGATTAPAQFLLPSAAELDAGVQCLRLTLPFATARTLHHFQVCRWSDPALGPLPWDAAAPLLRQLLARLSVLHGLGVIHRDVKPANCFLFVQDADASVGDDGSGLRIVLGDFGLARLLRGDPEEQARVNQSPAAGACCCSRSTVRGPAEEDLSSYVCTRGYRAPELLLGASAYGPEVDVWGCGVILAELLLGRPLWTKEALDSSGPIVLFEELLSTVATVNELKTPSSIKLHRTVPSDALEALVHLASKVIGQVPGSSAVEAPIVSSLRSAGATDSASQLVGRMLSLSPDARPTVQQLLSSAEFRELSQDCSGEGASPVLRRESGCEVTLRSRDLASSSLPQLLQSSRDELIKMLEAEAAGLNAQQTYVNSHA